MSKPETLREFSLSVVSEKGYKFHILYGYDLSVTTPNHYITASINGAKQSASKSVLNRVKKLGITEINDFINLIGKDETGITDEYYSLDILNNYISLYTVADASSLLTSITDKLEVTSLKSATKLENTLTRILDMDRKGKSVKSITTAYTKYLDSTRLDKLTVIRNTIRGIRKLYFKGVEIKGTHSAVKFEGYLKSNHYPKYYKRDMDLIRSSRVRIYSNILKRDYVPFKD